MQLTIINQFQAIFSDVYFFDIWRSVTDTEQKTNVTLKNQTNLATVKCEFSHDRYADLLCTVHHTPTKFRFDKYYGFGFDLRLYIFSELYQMRVTQSLNAKELDSVCRCTVADQH